jgi:uncharacterized membrane protein
MRRSDNRASGSVKEGAAKTPLTKLLSSVRPNNKIPAKAGQLSRALEGKKNPGTSRGNSQKNLTLATLLAGLLLPALTGLLLLLARLLLAAATLLLTGLALTALLLAGFCWFGLFINAPNFRSPRD